MLGVQVAHLVSHHFSDSYRLRGFVDDVRDSGEIICADLAVIGSLEYFSTMAFYQNTPLAFGIGYGDMRGRRNAFEKAREMGREFVSLVHPNSIVEPTVQLGQGVTVLAGAILDQYVTVGDLSYVHIGVKVGENCRIGTNNYFSAGSTLGGSVSVGNDNFFGINCTVVNDISVGDNNFINAESLVYKPLGDNLRLVEYREQRDVSNK